MLVAVSDADASDALLAERAFLHALDGSCRTPIAGYAAIDRGTLRLHGLVLSPDGAQAFDVVHEGDRADAARLGAAAGDEVKRRVPSEFFRV
jgi:hydroxymethylbilane synthase